MRVASTEQSRGGAEAEERSKLRMTYLGEIDGWYFVTK